MIAVTNAPVNNPMIRLVVRAPRMLFMRLPATFFSASAICSMPKRKTASPPKSCIPMVHQPIPWSSSAANAGIAASQRTAANARTVKDREGWLNKSRM
jgi:hypothetical protein